MNVRYITHDCKIKGYIDLTKHQKLLETIITMFDLPFAINSRRIESKTQAGVFEHEATSGNYYNLR